MICDFCKKEAIYLAKFKFTQRSGKFSFYRFKLCEEHLVEQKETKNLPKDHITSCAKIVDLAPCKRCGGSGSVPIPYAQGVCFLCGGTGKSSKVLTDKGAQKKC